MCILGLASFYSWAVFARDLAYKNVLTKQQEEVAQVFIKQLISDQGQDELPAEAQTEGSPTTEPIPSHSESEEPPAKCFKHLSRLSKLLEEKSQEKMVLHQTNMTWS